MQPATLPTARRLAGADADAGDGDLVAALRCGDEQAFAGLVALHEVALLRLARTFVRDRAVAEEVVQETWLAVLDGIDRFEGRSSLKTWIYQILSNRARTRAVRERRSAPFSALADDEREDGRWAAPGDWEAPPEQRVLGREVLARVRDAIAQLPPRQADVIVLRDVAGWEAAEVCEALGLSAGNQRILLHRARTKVRAALGPYLAAEAA